MLRDVTNRKFFTKKNNQLKNLFNSKIYKTSKKNKLKKEYNWNNITNQYINVFINLME